MTDKPTVAARWREHFKVLLNRNDREERSRNSMRIASDGRAVEPPTQAEVPKTINELKNDKAAGKYGIPGEFLEAGGERLHNAISRIWMDEQMSNN